jgi:methionine-rich copper-binding protein CopC
MTSPSRIRSFAALTILVATVAAFSAPFSRAEARRHVRLVRSEPAKDSVIRVAPTEIRLWFSEPLDLAVTRVRLTSTGMVPVPTGSMARADAADAPIVVPIDAPLLDGNYSVNWSSQSKDGHPMRGSFRFSVRVAP